MDTLLRIGRVILPPESRRNKVVGTAISAFWIVMATVEQRGLELEKNDQASSPLERYRHWTVDNQPDPNILRMRLQHVASTPTFSLIMDARGKPAQSIELTMASLRTQIYGHWNASIARRPTESHTSDDDRCKFLFFDEGTNPGSLLNDMWNNRPADFVGIVGAGDVLRNDALAQFALSLSSEPSIDLAYSDEDFVDLHGNVVNYFFKPDWSPDLLFSMNYCGRLTMFSKTIAGRVFQSTDGDIEHISALRGSECARGIIHISMPLCRRTFDDSPTTLSQPLRAATRNEIAKLLEGRGIKTNVIDGGYESFRVSYSLPRSPLVTIIIITRDRLTFLRRCLETLTSNTAYENLEVVIVDQRSRDTETLQYLRSLPHKVIRYDSAFNFAKINNLAVRQASGDLLVFLNNDTEVLEPQWLTEMVSMAVARKEVGIVGAKLLYPNGTIQHAGAIIGVGGTAGHAFAGLPNESPGYFNLPHIQRNVSAVTAACMLTKRELFDSLGGFDETFTVGGNDVDYCLRAAQRGYLTVYTPHAVLLHHEGVTREGFPPHNHYFFLKKWKSVIGNGDPYYNRNLSLTPSRLYWPKAQEA